jgi:hypothetical protein
MACELHIAPSGTIEVPALPPPSAFSPLLPPPQPVIGIIKAIKRMDAINFIILIYFTSQEYFICYMFMSVSLYLASAHFAVIKGPPDRNACGFQIFYIPNRADETFFNPACEIVLGKSG